MQAVADASHNMASEIGRSVRKTSEALTAALRLTQSGAKKVEAAMKAMETSTPKALDKIFKQFTSTDAEKLTAQINRLKIDLTQDFGSAITRTLGTVMELAGGADRLSAALQAPRFRNGPARGRFGRPGDGLYDLRLHAGAGRLDHHGRHGGVSGY